MPPANELAAYQLEKLCDDFIINNYPEPGLAEGYKVFLDDLIKSNESVHWKVDTLAILEMHTQLKNTFREGYDKKQSTLLPSSSIMICLKKASNSRLIDEFIYDKSKSGGYIGPHIIGGRLRVYSDDPSQGLNKVICVTDVIWRYQYCSVTNCR